MELKTMFEQQKESKTSKYALIGKFGIKVLTASLKFFKMFKFGILTVAAFTSYSWMLSWKFAILILLAVGWHEQGHVFAMKRCGFKEAKFIFLPFIGGVSYSKAAWKSYWDIVFIAISGPVAGFILAAFAYIGYISTGYPLLAAATSWICLMNLFNLFPISPFDGGHIAKSISMSFHKTKGVIIFGIISVVALFFLVKLHIILFVVFGVLGLAELILSYIRQRKSNKYIKETNKRIDGYIENLKNEISLNKDGEDIVKYCKNRIEYWEEFRPKEANNITLLTTNQILISAIGYGILVGMLVLLMHLTSHIPGADIAANFMADK
jgi:Zn-dependent protease